MARPSPLNVERHCSRSRCSVRPHSTMPPCHLAREHFQIRVELRSGASVGILARGSLTCLGRVSSRQRSQYRNTPLQRELPLLIIHQRRRLLEPLCQVQ